MELLFSVRNFILGVRSCSLFWLSLTEVVPYCGSDFPRPPGRSLNLFTGNFVLYFRSKERYTVVIIRILVSIDLYPFFSLLFFYTEYLFVSLRHLFPG